MKKVRTVSNRTISSKTTGPRRSKTRTFHQANGSSPKLANAPGLIQSGRWHDMSATLRQNLASGLGTALGNQQVQRQLIQLAPKLNLHDRIIATAEKTKSLRAVIGLIKQASDQEIENLNFSSTLRYELVNNLGIPNLIEVAGAIVDRQDQIEAAKRKKFLDAIEDTDRYILLANLKAKAWLGSLGNAYYNAWDRHNKTLDAQKADNESSSIGALIGSLILDAALTFATGGVGGLIAKKMKGIIGKDPDNYGAFMLDGIKDLGKFGVKTAGKGAIDAMKGDQASQIKPYPDDPFLWKGREEVRINSELALVTEKMIEWTKKVRANDPGFDYQFDPVEAIQKSLSVKGIQVESLQPVDEEQEAKNFEKGFWAAWLEKYAYSANLYGATSIEDPILQIPIKKTPISVIVKRCQELGLDVKPYVEASKQRAKRAVEDAKKLRRGELEA